MVLYIKTIEVPPNTPREEAIETQIEVEGEVLDEIWYYFPPGCFNGVHIAVFYGLAQVSPRSTEEWVKGDNIIIKDKLYWELPESPCVLTIKAWSECENFPHKITLYFHVSPTKYPRWIYPLYLLLKKVKTKMEEYFT